MRGIAIIGIMLFFAFSRAMAQPHTADFTRRFNAYESTWTKTRVHLILNQEKFFPGDTAWFKVYFLAEDLSPISGKQKIVVNLIDSHGDAQVHAIININDGVGVNQVLFPENLAPGIYLLTAHSSWMENFSPPPVFRKEIVIVRKNAVVAQEERRVSVFVEGGHLIQDVPNNVCFRADPPGSTVQLADVENGTVLGVATTDSNGLGSLVFTPATNRHYRAQLSGLPDAVRSLPATEEDGCAFLLTQSVEGKVKIRIAWPPESHLREKQLMLVVSGKGRILHTETFTPGADAFREISFNGSTLPGGVAHASLLDDTGRLLASRDFYNPLTEVAVARVAAPKQTFHTREEVTLEVSLTDETGQPIAGEFSISATNASLFSDSKRNSLADQLNIPYPGDLIVDRSDAHWMETVDRYLLCETQAVPWKEILSEHPGKPRSGFNNAIQMEGKVVSGETGQPVPDYTKILFYLQKDGMHYETFTLGGGHVRITLPDVFGVDEFFYIAQTRKGKGIPNVQVQWEQADTLALPASRASRETATADPYASFVSRTQVINRSYAFYAGANANSTDSDATTFEEEIGGADVDVNVRDYVAMSSMAELIREVIPSLYARQSGGESHVRVNLPEPLFPVRGDPVYIVDGIATKNTAFFLSLNPSDVLRVKVVTDPKKLIPLQLMGRNGIVIVETKMGNVREPLDDPGKVIAGVNRPVTFRGPDFADDPTGRIPEFRSTLYWNGSVKTDASGKASVRFFCSDDVGKVRIRIDGIAADARPFSGETELEVVDRD